MHSTPPGSTCPPQPSTTPPHWFDPPTRDRVYWLENVGRVACHTARVSWQVVSLNLPATLKPATVEENFSVSSKAAVTTQMGHADVNCSMPANFSSLASCMCPNPHMASRPVKGKTFPFVTLASLSDAQKIAVVATFRVTMPQHTDRLTVVKSGTVQQRTMQAIYVHTASAQTVAVYVVKQDTKPAAANPQTSAALVMPQTPSKQFAKLPQVHNYLHQLSATHQFRSHLPNQASTAGAASTALVAFSPPVSIMADNICPMPRPATTFTFRPSHRTEVATADLSTAVAVRTSHQFTVYREETCSADDVSTTAVMASMVAVAGSVYHAMLSTALMVPSATLPTPTLLATLEQWRDDQPNPPAAPNFSRGQPKSQHQLVQQDFYDHQVSQPEAPQRFLLAQPDSQRPDLINICCKVVCTADYQHKHHKCTPTPGQRHRSQL